MSRAALTTIVVTLLACSGGSPPTSPPAPPVSIATDIPLTTRPHMDAATQAMYDRIRARSGWILGVGALAAAADPFLTVAPSAVG